LGYLGLLGYLGPSEIGFTFHGINLLGLLSLLGLSILLGLSGLFGLFGLSGLSCFLNLNLNLGLNLVYLNLNLSLNLISICKPSFEGSQFTPDV